MGYEMTLDASPLSLGVLDPDPADRAKVIDMANLLNTAFDRWDVVAMVEVFTQDCVLRHPHAERRCADSGGGEAGLP
jgi:hypothetical protein